MNKFWQKIWAADKPAIEQQIRRRSIVAFSLFAVFILCVVVGLKLLNQHQDIFRKNFEATEKVFAKATYSTEHLSKTFPISAAAKKVRVNGDVGMKDDFDPNTWRLKVVRKTGDTLYISMDDIKAMPKTDIVFDFKCVEGWSQVTHWAGVKYSEFIKKYKLDPESKMTYVGMITPDSKYYVGIDMPSMMHEQTLLCYEMNGKALPMNQGYPLRLIIPVKYGIKHLKRIGTMYFSDTRPKDYWAERGYDYFAGL